MRLKLGELQEEVGDMLVVKVLCKADVEVVDASGFLTLILKNGQQWLFGTS